MKKNIIIFLFGFIFLMLPSIALASDFGFVNGDYVTIRTNSSTSSSKITRLIYGTKVEILEEVNDWYKVNYDGINTAYIQKQYVSRKSEITLVDEEYCNYLMEQGFPASYCPYLSYIHSLHPNWQYTALKTNLDFYKDVVDGEEGKNYIQYVSSDGTNFLDAYASSNVSKEAGGWYQANNTVNAYVLDPRNFLLEKSIFMFENLEYNSECQNETTVSTIFGKSSFLTTDGDEEGTYLSYYVDAGMTNGISPNHLAARTKQEGASSATYGPVTGTSTKTYNGISLTGYYNFFNIGAYADKVTSNPQVRGLAYAALLVNKSPLYGRPWDTRKKAIYGGAEFIANGYVKKGQNTLYLEKFNTNPNSTNSLYTHQYMTNIFAHYSEGLMMKNAYKSGEILDYAYNFLIPVYENMPEETLQATLLNGNNLLSSINLNGKPLNNFDSDITNYNEYILDDITEINLTATTISSDAIIEGTGVFTITEDTTTFNIKVTAQNGEEKVYTIIVERIKDMTTPNDIIENLSVKVNDLILYDFHIETPISSIIQTVQKISPNAIAYIRDIDGNDVLEGDIQTGYTLTLKTLISEEITYTLSVTGDLNGDGKINIQDLLKVQKHILGTTTLEDYLFYAADTNGDGKVNNIDLLRVQKHILGSINL